MELKLNKIDTDLRQKIKDSTKEGKIHGREDIHISKDKNQEGKPKFQLPEQNTKKGSSSIVVEAAREKEKDMTIDAENQGNNIDLLGRFIDIRK